jgi:hypothetical protein
VIAFSNTVIASISVKSKMTSTTVPQTIENQNSVHNVSKGAPTCATEGRFQNVPLVNGFMVSDAAMTFKQNLLGGWFGTLFPVGGRPESLGSAAEREWALTEHVGVVAAAGQAAAAGWSRTDVGFA